MNIIGSLFFATVAVCTLYILYLNYKKWKSYSDMKENWPPVIGPCPDYWIVSSDNTKCKNMLGVGELPQGDLYEATSDNTSGPINKRTKPAGLTKRCEWALKNGVPWEGIDKYC